MFTITPGTFVRLTLDEGHATIGLVTGYGPRRQSDGVQFVHVDWTPDVESARVETLPATILTAVCEWEDTYPDEYGMACSEPGIPTTITMPCRFDAQRVVRWVDPDHGSYSSTYCLDHALTATIDMQRDGVPFEDDDLDDLSSWWGHDEGGEG